MLTLETLTLPTSIFHGLTLGLGGFVAGCLAGVSGIGGGLLLVPVMLGMGLPPVQAIGTSTLAKLMISASGSWQNWRTGNLDFYRVATLGLPSLLSAQLGVYLASRLPSFLLFSALSGLLLTNIYLVGWRRRVNQIRPAIELRQQQVTSIFGRAIVGSIAGVLAGLFGVGGGILLVPLQFLLFGETIQLAVQTSLGVVFLSSMSACIGHTLSGNVLVLEGCILGITGAFGAQLGTRLLPRLDFFQKGVKGE